MNKKKIMWCILLFIVIFASLYVILNVRKDNESIENEDNIKVVVSNFASYDFLRAIVGDTKNVELKFILGPGKDSHSYEPTAQDLIDIQNADLFVYIGGKMEEWSLKVLESMDKGKLNPFCIANDVELVEEKEIDGVEEHEEEHEHEEGAFDEHIWTSPKNAKLMVKSLCNEMIKIDNKNEEIYTLNAEKYIKEIERVDNEIKDIVDNKVRDRLLFGDKMPMQYFIDYYGLKVSAAFSGCSTDAEPSGKTIAYLISVAKEEKIPVILYIELNTGKVASTIASEVGNGCTAMKIQTLHNVEKDDFENGETWVTLMERNIDVLKKALQ